MADLKFIISVDAKTGTANIKAFGGELDKLAKTSDTKTKPALAGLWQTFTIGTLAAGALQRGIGFLKNELTSTITAAMEAEEAENNLRLALETTGRQVGENFDHFNDYAESLMKVSRFDDEAIKSTQALLLQLTDLSQHGIDEATRGAIGLATVFRGSGMSLESAAKIVAKAMEGNVDMLGRYIPKLKDCKTDAEKVAVAQAELAKMFDRAKGSLNTTAGQVDRLKIYWGEFKEKIAGDWLNQFAESIKGLIGILKLLAETTIKVNIGIKAMTGTMSSKDFLKLDKDLAEKWKKGEQAVRDFVDSMKVLPLEYDKVLKASMVGREEWDAYMKAVRATDEMLAQNKDTITAWMTKQLEAIGLLEKMPGKIGPVTTSTIGLTEVIQTQTSALAEAGVNLIAFLGGLKDAPGYFNAVLPPAREMNDVLRQAADAMPGDAEFGGIPKAAEPAITTTRNYFDGLYNDIARGFGDVISSIKLGNDGLEIDFKELFSTIAEAWKRMVGEMIAGELLKKFQKWFTDIGDSAGKAVDKATEAIGGAAGGVANGLLGAVTAVASVVTALASVASLFKGPEKSTDVTYWLKLIYEWMGKQIMEKFDGLKGSMDLTRDSMLPVLAQIRDNTDCLKNIQYGQHGLDAVVHRPTLFMAGERGAERVQISRGQSSGATVVNVYLDGEKIGGKVISTVKRAARLGRLTFPAKAVT